MTTTTNLLADPRMTAAIAELTELIREQYPDTTFTTELGENEEAVFVTAVVDIDDPDEVVDCYIDRSVTLLVDERLPLHVIPVRTPAREQQLLATLRMGPSTDDGPRFAAG